MRCSRVCIRVLCSFELLHQLVRYWLGSSNSQRVDLRHFDIISTPIRSSWQESVTLLLGQCINLLLPLRPYLSLAICIEILIVVSTHVVLWPTLTLNVHGGLIRSRRFTNDITVPMVALGSILSRCDRGVGLSALRNCLNVRYVCFEVVQNLIFFLLADSRV